MAVRPLTSPIDGRVADINRRIGDATQRLDAEGELLVKLDAAVASFAEASTEATSYVGMELGRIAGLIDALERSSHDFSDAGREEQYRRRLAEAIDLPLTQLDAELASVLNHAAGHRGFAAQADLWFNPPVTVELGAGGARLAGCNERIVEVPFAMMALKRLQDGARILDIGSAESTFPLSAASLGFRVTAVDPRGLPYTHPNLHTFDGRFEDFEAPQERFDGVFLISTIEHVGLPAYGVTPHGDVVPGQGADRELLQRLRAELLAPNGIVVITTPFGKPGANDFERTYDADALDALLDGWTTLSRQIVGRRDETTWAPVDDREAASGAGVALIVATPATPA